MTLEEADAEFGFKSFRMFVYSGLSSESCFDAVVAQNTVVLEESEVLSAEVVSFVEI